MTQVTKSDTWMPIWLRLSSRSRPTKAGRIPTARASACCSISTRPVPSRLADFLANPEEAISAIAARCEREATQEDWGIFENADFAAVVSDIAGWSAGIDGVAILFNSYSVAPYAAGPHECRIPYTELARWLKPGGPLPPHAAANE